MAHSIVTWHNTPDTWEINEQVFTITKFLVTHQNKTYTHDGRDWLDTGLSLKPTQSEYEEWGFKNISDISQLDWSELTDGFNIIVWTDSDGPIKLNLSVPPFRPLDKLDDQFKIVAGEYLEDTPTTD